MYLKNNSDFQCGLRTKKEVITIKPGEAVHVFDSDIIMLNSKLVQITEKEFEALQKIEEKKEVKKEEKKEDKEDQPKVSNEGVDKGTSHAKDDIKENPELTNPEPEEKKDDTKENPELIALEAKLNDLMEQWKQAEKASKKATLQGKIKKVQEDIAKLKG